MLGNAVFWVNDRLWAMWTTFTYFAVFTAIAYFWLEPASFAFNNQNGLSDAGFSARPFLGVGLILGMAAFVFVDQFVMIRMRAKTYPQPVEVTEKDEDNDRTA
jgi:hypothetical protein